MTGINSNTELFCIFGNPVSHSLSPLMHNAAFKAVDYNAVYLAFQPDSIEQALMSMRALNIRGASITIPFKTSVLEYLDETDSLAADIGSVNTLHNINGKIIGYNTDGYGAWFSLMSRDIPIKNSNVLIIGNGGPARAIAFTLMSYGANITVAGRNADRLGPLVEDLKRKNRKVSSLLINDLTGDFISNMDILINTTPVGMNPDSDNTPIDENLLRNKHVVFDIVYSPHKTRLLSNAEQKECKTVYGIEMLLYQGKKQFEIWTGIDAPITVMRDVLEDSLHGTG